WQRDTGDIVPSVANQGGATAYAPTPGSYERGRRGYVHAQSARRISHPPDKTEPPRANTCKADANEKGDKHRPTSATICHSRRGRLGSKKASVRGLRIFKHDRAAR